MKRVFVLSNQKLFGQGIESLLLQEGDFDIVGREMDIDRAIERVRDLHPDVIIVDSADPVCKPTSAVMRMLGEGSGITVIGLNLENNRLCIYRGEERMVEEVEDLLRAIEHLPSTQGVPDSVGAEPAEEKEASDTGSTA